MTNGDSDYTPIDKEEYIMATWKNLDTLSSYDKLSGLKNHVDIATAMSGEQGGERVKNYSTPMAAGLQYNYAAKEVDETVLTALPPVRHLFSFLQTTSGRCSSENPARWRSAESESTARCSAHKQNRGKEYEMHCSSLFHSNILPENTRFFQIPVPVPPTA